MEQNLNKDQVFNLFYDRVEKLLDIYPKDYKFNLKDVRVKIEFKEGEGK